MLISTLMLLAAPSVQTAPQAAATFSFPRSISEQNLLTLVRIQGQCHSAPRAESPITCMTKELKKLQRHDQRFEKVTILAVE